MSGLPDQARGAETVRSPSEGPDEYLADSVFWLPKDARWSHLQDNARNFEAGIGLLDLRHFVIDQLADVGCLVKFGHWRVTGGAGLDLRMIRFGQVKLT